LALISHKHPVKSVQVSVDSDSHPASSFAEALERIATAQRQEQERGDLNPVCLSRLLARGEPAAKAAVLLHGFTSCPAQFVALGQALFEEGYNVYIPRAPYHGMEDLMSEALVGLTAERLAAYGMEAVDVAQGLGEQVVVCGLSMGGALAAWLAQKRADIDPAMLVAPFLGIGFVPAWVSRPLTGVTLALPDRWQWWDPLHKENNPETAAYGYRRYPTHAMAEVLRLGFATQKEARRERPKARRIVVVTNANDNSVHNGITAALAQSWRKRGAAVTTYAFAKSLGLPHDLIAPERPGSNVGVVYPVLLKLIAGVES
jgi:pimeloyl-ACP methyl ester carboxylesterase